MQIFLHLAFFLLTLFLMWWSGQNPRVLVYANLIALLLRMITVWYMATRLQRSVLSKALLHMSREPSPSDRGKPHRDSRTGEPAQISVYLVGILTLMFMLGCLQLLVGGTGFLAPEVFFTELVWALLLAGIFWVDDVVGRQFIVAPQAEVSKNLGYNTPPMNFMLAAIFLGAMVLLVAANIAVVIWGDIPMQGLWIDWVVLVILCGLKFAYEIAADWRSRDGDQAGYRTG